MSTFGESTIEGSLAEKILETIKEHEWNPPVLANDATRALIMAIEYITRYYSPFEKIE